jgi:hypothetical protein
MFTIPEGRTFWQAFADHVTLFKQHTSHLGEKMHSLTVDPVGMLIFIICFSCMGNSQLSSGGLTVAFSPPHITHDVPQRIYTCL